MTMGGTSPAPIGTIFQNQSKLLWYNLSAKITALLCAVDFCTQVIQSRGYSLVVEWVLPKDQMRVRFPLSAPKKRTLLRGFFSLRLVRESGWEKGQENGSFSV